MEISGRNEFTTTSSAMEGAADVRRRRFQSALRDFLGPSLWTHWCCLGSDQRGPTLAGVVPEDVHGTSGDCGVHDRSEPVECPATVDHVGIDPGGNGCGRDLRFQSSAIGRIIHRGGWLSLIHI